MLLELIFNLLCKISCTHAHTCVQDPLSLGSCRSQKNIHAISTTMFLFPTPLWENLSLRLSPVLYRKESVARFYCPSRGTKLSLCYLPIAYAWALSSVSLPLKWLSHCILPGPALLFPLQVLSRWQLWELPMCCTNIYTVRKTFPPA